MRTLLLISGPIAVGKSAIANELIQGHGFHAIKSSPYLRAKLKAAGLQDSRTNLQDVGDRLDHETDFTWLIRDVASPLLTRNSDVDRWLLDAVRKVRQVEHFRATYGDSVHHVHLTASEDVLKERYETRRAASPDPLTIQAYEETIEHPNERASRSLQEIAQTIVDVEHTTPQQAVTQILKALGWEKNHASDSADQR